MSEATEKKLTGKQRVFCDAYLSNGFNATQAARTAGYKGDDQTLSSVGYNNLRKPVIAAEINERMNECTASANEVMATLTTHMRGSIAKVLRAKGSTDLADQLEKDGADKIVKKLKVRRVTRTTKDGEEIEDVTEEFEIHDPQAAAEKIGKYHKLFTDRKEIGGIGGGPVRLVVEFFDEKPSPDQNE